MSLRRIRLAATITVVSIAMLMASAGEAKADYYTPYIPCESGRCIRAYGTGVMSCMGHAEDYGGAAFMLDLVNRYIIFDTTFGYYGARPVYTIFYQRFRIYENHEGGYASIMIGIPGLARAWFGEGGAPCGMDFYGFASFYNHREPVEL